MAAGVYHKVSDLASSPALRAQDSRASWNWKCRDGPVPPRIAEDISAAILESIPDLRSAPKVIYSFGREDQPDTDADLIFTGSRALRRRLRLMTAGLDGISLPSDVPDIRGYIGQALRGGLPETALAVSDRSRSRWLSSYIDHLVRRDVSMVGSVRDPMRLRHYLRALAANTAGTPAMKTLVDAIGIDRRTGDAYDALLEQIMITERVPAWSANQLARITRLPKRYLIDPAFMRPLPGIDLRSVLRNGDLIGRVLDTFVAAQLRAECVVSDMSPQMYHLRDANGRHEVDLLIEFANGKSWGSRSKPLAPRPRG